MKYRSRKFEILDMLLVSVPIPLSGILGVYLAYKNLRIEICLGLLALGNEEFFCQRMGYSGECWFEVNNQGDCDETCYNADMHQGATYKLKSIYYFCEDCHCKVAKIPNDKRY